MWSRKEDEPKPVETPVRPVSEPPRQAVETTGGKHVETIVKVGKSIYIRGELSGNEDLTIEGTVEGKIELRDHNLVVGSTGKIQAEIHAKTVTIQGEVQGNVHAEERIELAASGTVKGDLVAPRIVISDGARFKGTVDMDKPGDKPGDKPRQSAQPAVVIRSGAGPGPGDSRPVAGATPVPAAATTAGPVKV